MGKTVKMSFEGKSQQEPRNWQMYRILIILKKENGPRASSASALGLNTIIFKHVYWYMQQTQVSVYRTIGPLVLEFDSIQLFHTSAANSAKYFPQGAGTDLAGYCPRRS